MTDKQDEVEISEQEIRQIPDYWRTISKRENLSFYSCLNWCVNWILLFQKSNMDTKFYLKLSFEKEAATG